MIKLSYPVKTSDGFDQHNVMMMAMAKDMTINNQYVSEEVDFARRLMVEYSGKKDRSEQDWQPILEAYTRSRAPYVWEIEFAIDPVLYRALKKQRSKTMAENALDNWMGAPERERTPVLMRSMIDLCLTQTGADEELFRSNTPLSPLVCERIKQWENAFVNVPNFKPSLETGTQLMIERHHKIKTAISEDYGHIDTGNLKERVFSVPATCSFKEVKKKVDEENFKFVGDLTPLLDRMNEFANETMPNIRFSLHENGQHWIIFEASNLSEEDHTEALKDRLSGAWGEHLKYTGTLVGSKEVLPGWDVEGLRIEQSKNTAKPKKPHL